MKIIATVVTSMLLSVGLLVAPAAADEPPAEPQACEVQVLELSPMDGPDAIADLIAARERIAVLDGRIDGFRDLQARDGRTIDRQYRQIRRQTATIKRLRAKLAAAHG